MNLSPQEIKATVRITEAYANDPIAFFVEKLDVNPEHIWKGVRLPAESVRDNQRTAEKAGHSVSKTYTAGRIALWFLMTHYPSTVITTAPSHPLVEEQLWREIRTAHNNAQVPLGGKLTKTKLDLQSDAEKGEKWYAYGFSTKPDAASDEATKMQGYHNEWVLIIFDEANGILSPIWTAAEALLTSEKHKMLVLGNPTTATGEFPQCFSDPDYNKITVASTDTPNYIEDREVIPGLASRSFVERIARKFGVDSDIYGSRILGLIPKSDPDSIVSVDAYERAEGRVLNDVSGVVKKFLTVDVADGGNDDTVAKAWNNKEQVDERRYPGKRAEDIYGDIWAFCKQIGGNTIVYDDDGCGRVLGGLLRGVVSEDIDIIGFNGADTPHMDEDFLNRRAEGHFLMGQDFRNNLISVPRDHETAKKDVTHVKWGEAVKGKIAVEKKKIFKKREKRSPDDGDCIMMMSACYAQIKPIEKVDMYTVKRSTRGRGWR